MSKIDLPTRRMGELLEPLMQEGDTFHMTFRKNGDYVNLMKFDTVPAKKD